jgi:hypothetical protein
MGGGDFPSLKFGQRQAQDDGLVTESRFPKPCAIDLALPDAVKRDNGTHLEIGKVIVARGLQYVLIDRVPNHGRESEPHVSSDEPPVLQIYSGYPYR